MVFGRVRIHNANNNPRRNRKADKDFAKEVDFKDTKFPFKLELFKKKKKKKKNYISINVFGYENKEEYPI